MAPRGLMQTAADPALSEARLRDFAACGSDWFFELDADLRFSYITATAQGITGEDPHALMGRRPTPEALLDVDDRAWAQHVADLEAHRPIRDFRFARRGPDGRIRHVSVTAKPIFDRAGAFQGYRGVGSEVTRLVEAERFMRAVVDAMPALINVKDVDGRYVFMNGFHAAALGTTPSQVVGKTAAEIFAADFAAGAAEADRRVIASGEALGPYEGKVPLAHDSARDWLHQKMPLKDEEGRVSHIVTVAVDITAQKAIERELREVRAHLAASEARFRDFTDAAAHWVWGTDRESRFTYVSEGFERRTGIPAAAILGRHAADISADDPRRHEAAREIERFQRRREPFMDIVVPLPIPDGRTLYQSVSGKPVLDDSGAFAGYRGSTRDITGQRAAELEAVTLRTERDVAAGADRAKTQFLACMSHELRTPLNAIIGFSEFMTLGMFGALGDPRYATYAAHIHDSAQHLLAVINDLLDMSRVELGRYEIECAETTLASIVKDSIAMVGLLARSAELECAAAAAGPEATLLVDPRAIKQILVNLLSNAIKFTPPGGRITVATRWGGDGSVLVTVADTGVGIPEGNLEDLFDAFVRGDASQARGGGGAGLGLWISRALARLHGGDLALVSTEGDGTTATLILPPERVVASPNAAVASAA